MTKNLSKEIDSILAGLSSAKIYIHEAKKALSALIAEREREARQDEFKHLLNYFRASDGKVTYAFIREYINQRAKRLKGKSL